MYRGRQGVAAIFVFLILVVIVAAVVLLPRACSANESPGSEEAETMPVSGASLSDQPDAYWYQRSIGLKDAWDLMRKHSDAEAPAQSGESGAAGHGGGCK